MEDIWAALFAAVALGATHALEVDHMVAVQAFLGNRPRVGIAVGFGMRWGMGHAAVVLLAGLVLAVAGITVPAPVQGWFELTVGTMLIGLGGWAAWNADRLHVHTPVEHEGHAHLHAHAPAQHPHSHRHADPSRHHRHLSTAVGAVHGLAGTASVVALVPVTLMPDVAASVVYLAAFGLGTVAAMGAYAGIAAAAVARVKTVVLARTVAWVTAGASVIVGVWWVVRAAPALGAP